jgi:hypothetical protein
MGLMFGYDDTISCIVDVPVKGPHDEALCLASRHTKLFIGAGVYLKDHGYALKVKSLNAYIEMPEGEELARFQESGMLPKPLPPYSIGAFHYLIGYSLWIVIAGVIAVEGAKKLFKKPAPARAAYAPPPDRVGTPTHQSDLLSDDDHKDASG